MRRSPSRGREGEKRIVLHVLEALRGGTSRHVLDIVRSVDGYRHHVATAPPGRREGASGAPPDTAALQEMAAAGAVLHTVPMSRNPANPANGAGVLALKGLLLKVRPALVHGHSSVGGAVGRLGAWGQTPAVYTPNALSPALAAQAVERLLGPLTAALIAVSASEAEEIFQSGLLPGSRVAVIPNGIDLSPPGPPAVDLRDHLGLPPGAPLVGTIARLVDQKAPIEHVAAFVELSKTHPDVHFLLIGQGPLQEDVDLGVALGGIGGRFHQLASLPRASSVLGQLDVFCLLSAFEGGPYAPLEAMLAGCPVVLSDVVGNKDVVEDGASGLLCPFADAKAAAAAMASLLDDPGLRARIAAAGGDRVRQHFDVQTMARRLGDLYGQVIAGTF